MFPLCSRPVSMRFLTHLRTLSQQLPRRFRASILSQTRPRTGRRSLLLRLQQLTRRFRSPMRARVWQLQLMVHRGAAAAQYDQVLLF